MAAAAERQKGIVTRQQLLAAGLSGGQIDRLIAAGHLIRIHQGVYLVGHRAVHPLAYETAALLACRPRAFLSHHTAARLWKLPCPDNGSIHVTLVARWCAAPQAVCVHTIKWLRRAELRRHDGLPVASPSLTLLDTAGACGPEVLAAALNEARVHRLVTDRDLTATLKAHPTRRGAKLVRAHLAAEQSSLITHSEAERLALRLMRAHGIEPDATQYPVGPYRLDFYFEAERLAVEVDGRRFHDTPKRFVEDRRRTAYLAARNIQVLPLTWHDLHGGQARAMQQLRQARAARRKLFRNKQLRESGHGGPDRHLPERIRGVEPQGP